MQLNIIKESNFQITCQYNKYGDLMISKSSMETQEG